MGKVLALKVRKRIVVEESGRESRVSSNENE